MIRTTLNLDADVEARLKEPSPTERHAALFKSMLQGGRAAGDHPATPTWRPCRSSAGFSSSAPTVDLARYPGLRWHDPSPRW